LKKGDVVIAWMSASNMDGNMFDNSFSIDIHKERSQFLLQNCAWLCNKTIYIWIIRVI